MDMIITCDWCGAPTTAPHDLCEQDIEAHLAMFGTAGLVSA